MAVVFFTGGARSGKSAAATDLAYRRMLDGERVTVVTFGVRDGDPEMAARIERHRADRPEGFETLEPADPLAWTHDVDDAALLVVDCMGTLLARVMGDIESAGLLAESDGFHDRAREAALGVVDALFARPGDTIIVSNEVGDGIVPMGALSRHFRDVLGFVNRSIVSRADASYLCVCGRLVDLSASPRSAVWPND